jgi:hypothetical protein
MIDLKKVSACLISKEYLYPREVLTHTASFPFGEILILTSCDSPYRKYELFTKAKYELLYYSDDDAICPITQLCVASDPKQINVAMKPHHYTAYAKRRMTMGLGWGSIFPRSVLSALDKYRKVYGEDALFKRDTEKILTQLVYPQNRLELPITDLPSATAPDRLHLQPEHYSNMDIIEQRCAQL